MFKFLNFSIKFIIVFFAIVIFFVFSTLWYFSVGLPDYKKLSNYQPPISSRVYSKDGKLIAEYALEKRLFVPYESIPNKVINSFLSAEDKNFFNHPGVDAKGILRATIKNTKNMLSDKRLEGASTITQQVAKNFLLTNEISIKRKIKEAILAFRIERAYKKDCDKIILEGVHSIMPNQTLRQIAINFLWADSLLYNGSHYNALTLAFGAPKNILAATALGESASRAKKEHIASSEFGSVLKRLSGAIPTIHS